MKGFPPLLALLLPALAFGCGVPGTGAPDSAASLPAAGSAVPVSAGTAPASSSWLAEAVFLVRHAERAPEPADDPGLTPVGSERARELARLLGEGGVTHIHSTDTRRTRETADPLARELGLPVTLYDSGDLASVAEALRSRPGRHLVVGHSNTTPDLAEALGGEGHGPIVEAWEYDRLYLLSPDGHGGVTTLLLRFGPPVERP